MKIGLIGAQNSHSRHFCEVINKKRPWEDVIISYIYGGDDLTECKLLCDEFGITECSSEDEVIEKSDAIVITYRKGSVHYEPVVKSIMAGKPIFNDKPFTTDLCLAEKISSLAKEHGVLLTGGSSLKGLTELPNIKENIMPGSTIVITFAADPASEYDGYWFYGIHVAEVCLALCGLDFISVQSFKNHDVVITNVAYTDKLCILATAPNARDLKISISNAGKTICLTVPLNYQGVGPEEFVNMVKTGKPPRDYAYYVKAVELMSKIHETAGM